MTKRPGGGSKGRTAFRYAALFLALAAFSALSLGYVRRSSVPAAIRGMLAKDPRATNYLFLTTHGGGRLALADLGVVCRVTEQQADQLTRAVRTRTQLYEMDGRKIRVLRVEGSPANHAVIKSILGERLEDPRHSRVIRQGPFFPIVTAAFVS
jgi:hypothetical protein